MTACVNKKSKRVAAVVTASLVGALSIGAPAVALAANGGIEMLAADWATDAKVSKATDGKGGSVSDPLKATFEAGSGKYLVPTQVANQHVTTDIDEDFEIVYKAANLGSDYTGLNNTWEYKSDALGLEKFEYNQATGLTAEQAATYFSGKLTDVTGKAIAVKADGYTVKVTSKADGKSVSTLFRVADPAAKTYTAIQYNAEDPTDSSDKTLTFTGKALWSATAANATLAFVDDEGTVVTPSNVTFTKVDGTEVNDPATNLKDAGNYVATFDGNVVPLTVEKLDLSTAVLGVKNPSGANSASAFLGQLTVNSVAEADSAGGADSKGDVFGLTVTKIVNPAGGASFTTTPGLLLRDRLRRR